MSVGYRSPTLLPLPNAECCRAWEDYVQEPNVIANIVLGSELQVKLSTNSLLSLPSWFHGLTSHAFCKKRDVQSADKFNIRVKNISPGKVQTENTALAERWPFTKWLLDHILHSDQQTEQTFNTTFNPFAQVNDCLSMSRKLLWKPSPYWCKHFNSSFRHI